MEIIDDASAVTPRRRPCNKGKLIGPKPPLQPKHVWAIRTRLQLAGRTRDLALFNLAIDSKLRGCDLVSLKVEDVAPHGYAIDRATVRQSKSGSPVRFEITEQTRQAIDEHLAATGSVPAIFCSIAAVPGTAASPPANMPVCCWSGSPASVSTRPCSAPIRCDELRPP
jgi:integrase